LSVTSPLSSAAAWCSIRPWLSTRSGPLIPACPVQSVCLCIQKAVQSILHALFHHLVKMVPDLPAFLENLDYHGGHVVEPQR
jgi:hypothetical protein